MATGERKISLNVGGKDRKTFKQQNPDDFEFATELEEAINDMLAPNRIVSVSVSWMPVPEAPPPPPQKVKEPPANDGMCIVCDSLTHNNREGGPDPLMYSAKHNVMVHLECIQDQAAEHFDNPMFTSLLRSVEEQNA